MNEDPAFRLPEVTDDDILHASSLLELKPNAFYGENGDDPRQEVLKSMETMDIAACPGSGKTTLLVAKLAILAAKWQDRTRGICVLSHTNEARRQIQTKLGNTAAGRRLLSYPHYIGTIHGFVDRFLAIPWLRRLGYPIKMIDTNVCLSRRWKRLPYETRKALETNRYGHSILTFRSPDFDIGDVRWGKGHILGKDTPTYNEMRKACQQSCIEGYFCYDEMFVWAYDMIEHLPSIAEIIRSRFPLLFIDEAQDTRKEQSEILGRIFTDQGSPVLRQRFGDANQAIYNSERDRGATTDVFPHEDTTKRKDLPNSHRFGPTIAKLAGPLGLDRYDPGLQGKGPKAPLQSGEEAKHTIFLFDNDSCPCQVISAYAELLIKTFSPAELSKKDAFWAVGQVHRPPEKEGDHKHPHHVGHYCRAYDAELSKSEPRPPTFVQYVFAGVGKSEKETSFAVEKVAEGVLRLAGMLDGATHVHFRHVHRRVLKLLASHPDDVRESYEALLLTLVVERKSLTEEEWNGRWKAVVRNIAAAISDASGDKEEANDFLAWNDEPGVPVPDVCERKGPGNVCRYRDRDNREVCIDIGSIHSIKGQNHMATLVMETFWNAHNLEKLIPWIIGERQGWNAKDKAVEQPKRLKIHYVAMTRPSHLLCLAMKRSAFEKDTGLTVVQEQEWRGWRIKCI